MPGALDMALDDVIESSWKTGDRGEKGGKSGKGRGRGKGAGKSSGGRTSKEDSLNMSLDEMIEGQESEGKGKGSWKGKGKSYGKGKYEDSRDSWGSKGGYASSWPPKGKGKEDRGYTSSWSKGKGKKGEEKGSWRSSAPAGIGSFGHEDGASGKPAWMEHDDWRGDEEDEEEVGKGSGYSKGAGKAWGKGKGADSADWRKSKIAFDDEPQRWDTGRSWEPPARPRAQSWEEDRSYAPRPRVTGMRSGDDAWGGPPRRAAAAALDLGPSRGITRRRVEEEPEPRPRATRAVARGDSREPPPQKRLRRNEDAAPDMSRAKRIKVTNVPRDLGARDIKEAFESEAGKTLTCELERGTCYITFSRAADAQKAVETFDRGELNGKMISVTLDP